MHKLRQNLFQLYQRLVRKNGSEKWPLITLFQCGDIKIYTHTFSDDSNDCGYFLTFFPELLETLKQVFLTRNSMKIYRKENHLKI